MALIKSAKSDRMLKEAIVLDMGDLGRQAERMLSGARAEAARIIEHAQAQAQCLIGSADERGYNQGLERGMLQGREAGQQDGRAAALQQFAGELERLTQQWTAALVRWDADRQFMFHHARVDVIGFAFALAEKIVHRLVQSDPTIVCNQLTEALALVSKPTAIEIAINPQDRALIEQVLPTLLATMTRCQQAGIREDASLARGGCVVLTAGGHVDASIQTQLDRIAEALIPSNSAIGRPDDLAVANRQITKSPDDQIPTNAGDDGAAAP